MTDSDASHAALTDHLQQFGAVDIARADYRRRLNTAMERTADFYLFPAYADGEAALQAIGLDVNQPPPSR